MCKYCDCKDVINTFDNEGEACFGDISFNPSNKTLSSWDDGANPLIVHIQYCPFCGRKLGD